MDTVLASPAPATPSGRCVPQPAINIGASTVFNTTVSICTIMVGFTIPVPRKADAIATCANCNAMPGVYQ